MASSALAPAWLQVPSDLDALDPIIVTSAGCSAALRESGGEAWLGETGRDLAVRVRDDVPEHVVPDVAGRARRERLRAAPDGRPVAHALDGRLGLGRRHRQDAGKVADHQVAGHRIATCRTERFDF